MDWTDVGDANPKGGVLLFRNAQIDASGDFEAEAVEAICETNVGGDECRFLLRRGTVFLSSVNLVSALKTVGASIFATTIARQGAHGDGASFEVTSEEGLRVLFHAAHAYGGIDSVEIEALVQLGPDMASDLERKFEGDITLYNAGTSLWAILAEELELGDFEKSAGKPKPVRLQQGWMAFSPEAPIIGLDPHPAYAPDAPRLPRNEEDWAETYHVGPSRDDLEAEAREDLESRLAAVEEGDLEDTEEEADVILPVAVGSDGSLIVLDIDRRFEVARYTAEQLFGAFGMEAPKAHEDAPSP
jgi:hypothetical protein